MSHGGQYLNRQRIEETLRLRAELARRQQLEPLESAPDLAILQRIDRNAVDVQSVRIDDIEDFPEVARLLKDVSDLVRDVALPSVRRALEPLRISAEGPRSTFFGDERVGGVPELVNQARKTSTEMANTLHGVVTSLADAARVVEQVGHAFADVQQMSTDRLESMNQQFSARLRGPGQGPPDGSTRD